MSTTLVSQLKDLFESLPGKRLELQDGTKVKVRARGDLSIEEGTCPQAHASFFDGHGAKYSLHYFIDERTKSLVYEVGRVYERNVGG